MIYLVIEHLPHKQYFLVVILDTLLFSILELKQYRIYSLMLSSFETACHNCVLTYDGILGSCVTSSNKLIVLLALTDSEYSALFKSVIRSIMQNTHYQSELTIQLVC